jgi:hypothetical protein
LEINLLQRALLRCNKKKQDRLIFFGQETYTPADSARQVAMNCAWNGRNGSMGRPGGAVVTLLQGE